MLLAGSVAAGRFNISHFQGRPAPTAYITQETDVGNTQSSLSLPVSLSVFLLCLLFIPLLSFTHTMTCPRQVTVCVFSIMKIPVHCSQLCSVKTQKRIKTAAFQIKPATNWWSDTDTYNEF